MLENDDDGVQCDLCDKWFCIDERCSGMTESFHDQMHDLGLVANFLWYCTGCREAIPSVKKVLSAITKLTVKNEKLESRVNALEEKMETVSNLHLDYRMDEAVRDYHERDKRKGNLIVYNLSEPAGENTQEKRDDDKMKVQEMCVTLNIENANVENVERLGRERENLEENPRPLKVSFTNDRAKLNILKNSAKLKEKNNFAKVTVTPDYTFRQRQMNKELKQEVARRRVMDRSFTYKKMKAELASKVAYNSGPRFQEPDDVEILSPSQRESRIPRFSQRFANSRIVTASPKKNEQLGSSQIQTRVIVTLKNLVLVNLLILVVLIFYSESDRDYVGSDVNSVSSQSSASSDQSSQNTSINSVESSILIENQNGLKCLYTNADSISNKWSELEALVYLHQPDIVGLTEAFKKNLENPNLSSYVLQGYHVFCNPKFQNAASRGTLLFVRDYLDVTEYKKLNENSAKEAIWCEIKINNLEKLLVGLVYRSPNSSAENNVAINEMISALNNETQSRVVVMGDFNYRDIDWKHWISSAPENHVSHEFIEAVRGSYLHQNIEFYTRYRNGQRPSTLDLVFSSEELLVNNIEHFSPLGKSDHIVITFGIDCNSNNEAYMKEFDLCLL
ncbi:uncharacterized protein LOC132717356 [Ruditapes philippinarum]|uniref:uncharacterized protein LOC132717356 n=1 Tax=Ruditapes philippinarum TaxID=129788 RepID=UPI00295B860A|nr:uncharacterized protein LOC132717356 [Ruditapes philippinarum]